MCCEGRLAPGQQPPRVTLKANATQEGRHLLDSSERTFPLRDFLGQFPIEPDHPWFPVVNLISTIMVFRHSFLII